MTEGRIVRITPLVNQLQRFCRGHEAGDGGFAAAQMLADVRDLWPDVAEQEVSHDPDTEKDPEVLALHIVRDVGETAGRLIESDPREVLGWSRANLIFDLERYLEAIGGR
jgi:hypothetical protein